jgi:hypothetical protein
MLPGSVPGEGMSSQMTKIEIKKAKLPLSPGNKNMSIKWNL